MDLSMYYTKAKSDQEKIYLEGSDNQYWVLVRKLNRKERNQRDSLGLRETKEIPLTEKKRQKLLSEEVLKTSLEYKVEDIRQFEYEKCLLDFCLPFLPENCDKPIPFKKSDRTNTDEDVEMFLNNMPPILADWVEECIVKVNRWDSEGKKEEEEIKNV